MSVSPMGPGALLLVVGPSGAGKDTVLDGARTVLSDDPGIVFARRVVTRVASASEDNDSLDEESFAAAVSGDAFALHWDAHGHRYGIPRAIDDMLRAGQTVICNVSRTVVAAAREAYAAVTVIEITAPPAVLAERLARRGREAAAGARSRLERNDRFHGFEADQVIDNSGDAAEAVARFVAVVRGLRR